MVRFPEKPPLFRYQHVLRSRYGETDQMGYVYYGRYPEFFEVARTEMLRSAGLTYSSLEREGFMLPVISMEIDYKQPLFYDEEMQIEVKLFDAPVIRLHTYYEIHTTRSEESYVNGRVSLCFVNAETRKPVKAPATLLNMLNES
ncbi:MAG: YbgC/FadM family acyl-CoA thioesterase [Bacteroidetes bacterium]|nr:YbgC/FadM family acyl-CoA thioesterase [Bacteroidota bacterium]